MISLASFALFAWLPILALLFQKMPPRRAVALAAVTGYLFLPGITIEMQGLPDFSKVTVMSLGTLLLVAIHDPKRLFSFRFKWYDVPMLVFCTSTIATHSLNQLPLYNGLTASLERVFHLWHLLLSGPGLFQRPRRHSGTGTLRDSRRFLVRALCLWEIRMSPHLNQTLYGFTYTWNFTEGVRWGGYRPLVFMTNGLVLSMWMTAASLIAYWLWMAETVKSWFDIKFSVWVAVLLGTTILCKSTGALLLLAVGIGICHAMKAGRSLFLPWVLVLVPIAYIGTRATGIWSAQQLIDWTDRSFGELKRVSVAVRIENEDRVVKKAWERPWFGWGGARGRVVQDGQDITITDGLWICVLADTGLVGVASCTAVFCLPQILLLRRYPMRIWMTPGFASAAASSIAVGLYGVDNLSNATINPVITLMAGGLMSLTPARSPSRNPAQRAAETEEMATSDDAELIARYLLAGQVEEAAAICRESVQHYERLGGESSRDPRVRRGLGAAQSNLGAVMIAAGDWQGGREAALTQAMALQQALADEDPSEDTYRRDLMGSLDELAQVDHATGRLEDAERLWLYAQEIGQELLARNPADIACLHQQALRFDRLGRVLFELGHVGESEQVRHLALDSWAALAAQDPGNPEYVHGWAQGSNDLAWALAGEPGTGREVAVEAVQLAAEATRQAPDCAAYWNTLGVVSYRAGDVESAARALERSADLNGGGTAFDHFFLALAYHGLGQSEAALQSYRAGDAWMVSYRPEHPELLRARAEAAAILGIAPNEGAPDSRLTDGLATAEASGLGPGR